MIKAESFVEAARAYGFKRYTGVPCSFLTPFINYVINDDKLNYVSSANEGDALATAAGATIGGEPSVVMMQNSGLGNAVSPITSLSYVFRIPLLIITSQRGAPNIKDEPQHELMGQITGELFDTMKVPWEIFPSEEQDIKPALQRAMNYMKLERRPYALIMQKGTVSPHELERTSIPRRNGVTNQYKEESEDTRPGTRSEALKRIIDHTPESDSVIIATTGFTGRELYAIEDRKNQFYMVGSMGCASSLGLGLAMARPDLKVVIVDGDGAALMRMGNFATLASYGGNNLIHILLDNEVHDSTGAQATVSSNIAFADIAAACGYTRTYSGNESSLIDNVFKQSGLDGPCFVHLKTQPGTIANLPRPDVSPAQVLQRLMKNIHSEF